MQIILTGATGMVGQHVLNQLLEAPTVDTVLSIGRRTTGIEHKKLKEIQLSDFLSIGELKDQLWNLDACIHCLGVYQNQVSKEDFFTVTCEYQQALTNVLQETSPNLTFCLFGATGADPSEKNSITFAQAKGRAENLLMQTCFPKKYIFRPGYIKPTGTRQPSGWMYTLAIPISNVVYSIFPKMGIDDADLAKAMVQLAINPKLESQVFENNAIKEVIRN